MIWGGVCKFVVFDQITYGVEAETVDAYILEPERGNFFRLLSNRRIVIVQVGHLIPKDGVIISSVWRLVPGRCAPRTQGAGILVFPDIPIVVLASRFKRV